jgi:hypothetical protein
MQLCMNFNKELLFNLYILLSNTSYTPKFYAVKQVTLYHAKNCADILYFPKVQFLDQFFSLNLEPVLLA